MSSFHQCSRCAHHGRHHPVPLLWIHGPWHLILWNLQQRKLGLPQTFHLNKSIILFKSPIMHELPYFFLPSKICLLVFLGLTAIVYYGLLVMDIWPAKIKQVITYIFLRCKYTKINYYDYFMQEHYICNTILHHYTLLILISAFKIKWKFQKPNTKLKEE